MNSSGIEGAGYLDPAGTMHVCMARGQSTEYRRSITHADLEPQAQIGEIVPVTDPASHHKRLARVITPLLRSV